MALACGAAWLGASAPLYAGELNGYLTVASDYVFRGVSQSNEDPTVQAGLDYLHDSGVFAGIFVAHIDYPASPFRPDPGDLEIDAYLGYSHAAARDWTWDVALLHYDFPDSDSFDYAYQELAANLHYRDRLRVGATVSDDIRGSDSTGWTSEIELRHPLGERFQLSGSIGRYEFERTDWQDYAYWDFGVSAVFDPVTVDLRYFDTSEEAETFAGRSLTGSRVVASVSVGF